jgi:hypothetical protein
MLLQSTLAVSRDSYSYVGGLLHRRNLIRKLPSGPGSALVQDAHLLFAFGLMVLLHGPELTENGIHIRLPHGLQGLRPGCWRREQRKNFILRPDAAAVPTLTVDYGAAAPVVHLEIVTTFA